MFVNKNFTEIRPVWVDDLEIRPKISWDFCFNAVGHNAKKIKNWELQ
jgi:hypothetical protein